MKQLIALIILYSIAFSSCKDHDMQTATCEELLYPAEAATNVELSPTFRWCVVEYATKYRIQVDTTPRFTSSTYNLFSAAIDTVTTGTSYLSQLVSTSGIISNQQLASHSKYYWRVLALKHGSVINRSDTHVFYTHNNHSDCSGLLPAMNADNVELNPLFRWCAVDGAASYRLLIDTTPYFTSHINTNLPPAIDTTLTTSECLLIPYRHINATPLYYPRLTSNSKYYWRVKSFNQDGVLINTSDVYTFNSHDLRDDFIGLYTNVNKYKVYHTASLTFVRIYMGTTNIQIDKINSGNGIKVKDLAVNSNLEFDFDHTYHIYNYFSFGPSSADFAIAQDSFIIAIDTSIMYPMNFAGYTFNGNW